MALQDLDELILKCRNEESKELIKEAIACYKAGAYRASISSTWLALVFDYIEKIKLLSNLGDNEAEVQYKVFIEACDKNDIRASLVFERGILEKAKNNLHLISESEFIDLQRLYLDRCRCVHPSINVNEEIFIPSAELARVHLCNTVDYFLSLPPVQGKAALTSIMKIINSMHFPSDQKQAEITLKSTALNRARPNLIRLVIYTLMKSLAEDQNISLIFNNKIAALKAMGNLYHEDFQNSLKKNLTPLIRNSKDENISKILCIVASLDNCWENIDSDAVLKLEIALKNLPSEDFSSLDVCLGVPALEKTAIQRIEKVTRSELTQTILFIHTDPFFEKIIDFYINSGSFAEAKELKGVVIYNAPDFSKDQIFTIIDGCAKNGQVWDSTGFNEVIIELSKNKNFDLEEYKALLSKYPRLTGFIKDLD